MGNDGSFEPATIRVTVGYCEAYAVDGNAAFGDEIAGNLAQASQ